MAWVSLVFALSAASPSAGLTIGGLTLGQSATPASLQASFPGATCSAPYERAGWGQWTTCSVPILFAGQAVAARGLIEPGGMLHAVEFALPEVPVADTKATFGRQYGQALEVREQGDMRYFGLCRQTALAVFAREHGAMYVTYTWLKGSRSFSRCP